MAVHSWDIALKLKNGTETEDFKYPFWKTKTGSKMAMKKIYVSFKPGNTNLHSFNPFVCPLNFAAHHWYIIYSNSVSITSAISIHFRRSFKSFKFQSRTSHDNPKSYQYIRVFCWCRKKPSQAVGFRHYTQVIQKTHHQNQPTQLKNRRNLCAVAVGTSSRFVASLQERGFDRNKLETSPESTNSAGDVS